VRARLLEEAMCHRASCAALATRCKMLRGHHIQRLSMGKMGKIHDNPGFGVKNAKVLETW